MNEFFKKENIEFYFVHKYSSLKITSEKIEGRMEFVPKSTIVYLIPYFTEQGINISSYAVSRDYHIYIKELNSRLIKRLSEIYPENHFAGFGDKSPIDERHAAASGGLGIIGKNGLLINEKYGSYVFIAEVITDIEPEKLGAENSKSLKKCCGCNLCEKACPTGALTEHCECLSNITQRKGELSDEEIILMKKVNTVWGCDECQRVCPYNKSPRITPIEFFHEGRIANLTADNLNAMDLSEFSERAYSWRGKKTIQRNIEKF